MRLRSPAPFSGGVAHQQSARLTCERQRGQHSSLPPFSEGIAQPVRADASHASGRRRESFCPHHFHFCPCGVAQSTCLPLKQEITGAKPVRDASFFAPKALSAMRSLGKRISSVQLRMGAPAFARDIGTSKGCRAAVKRRRAIHPRGESYGSASQSSDRPQAPQSNQRSGRRHKPATPRAALGTATISSSMQQPADFFCKEIVPGQHRLEAPFLLLA